MGGIKRKEAPGGAANGYKKQKTVEHKSSQGKKKSRLDEAAEDDDFGGFDDEDSAEKSGKNAPSKHGNGGSKEFKLEGTTSAEAHAKQRALAKERKAAKPNADIIARSKKIWEKLRRKSHVPKEERKELVDELFSIITGRVREFVFKHDSVRVIQCALKYANQEQRRMIVDELRDDIRPLVESKYGKFLVAKMVVEGDQAIRNVVVPQFYGHVKRLINHPEASWIVDDIYRQIATSQQKAIMLREWYGTEFALENRDKKLGEVKATADLKQILEEAPEKRKPVMQAANQLINSLIQKKMTGFTMLHDAMLQYFLALQPSTEEHSAFLELLKGDIETKVEAEAANSTGGGDLFRNLAFTKSGSRLVCLAIAYGSAKDRKVIMKCFKDTVDMMCFDQYAKMVLVAGLDVPDDTKMSGKAIFHELLGQNIEDETQRLDRLEQIAANLNARVPMLYPLAGPAKWLINDVADKALLEEIYEIRKTTSKKAPESRRKELLQYLSSPLLDFVTKRASNLAQSSFGCQCITETLLEANSDATAEQKTSAKEAVAQLAAGDPSSSDHVAQIPAVGRMLKTLVLGGNFDPETKSTKLVELRLGFAEQLFPVIEECLVPWACGPSPFVVVALLESEDVSENVRQKVKAGLKKGKKEIEKATKGDGERKGSAGAKLVLEKL